MKINKILLLILFSMLITGCVNYENPLKSIPNNVELGINEEYIFNISEPIIIECENDNIIIDTQKKGILGKEPGVYNIRITMSNNLSEYKNIQVTITENFGHIDFFENVPSNIDLGLGEIFELKINEEIIVTSSNENVSIMGNCIIGVTQGFADLTLTVKSKPTINKKVYVQVINNYIDHFPTIPSLIRIEPEHCFYFDINEDIIVKVRDDISLPTQIVLKYDAYNKKLISKYFGATWVEIIGVKNNERRKLVYVISSMDDSKNLNSEIYKTYSFSFNVINKFPDFLEKKDDLYYKFITDKAYLFDLFTNSIKQDIPQDILELSMKDYEVLILYQKRSFKKCVYDYADLNFDKLSNSLIIKRTNVGGGIEDAMIDCIDVILISKQMLASEINNLQLDKCNLIIDYINR